MGLNVLIKLVLQKSLKSMWGVLDMLQLIVFYQLIKVSLAPHATLLLSELKSLVLGEFIPFDWLKSKAQEKFPEHYSYNKTDDISVVEKVGSIVIILAVMILLALPILLCRKCCNMNCVNKLKSKLIWNPFIRCSLQAYLQIGFVNIPILLID